MRTYDYIISGAGASGLSLLVHMIRSGAFSSKKILLLDKQPKTSNDRTWCFWEKHPGMFEELVHRRWNKLWFHDAVTRTSARSAAAERRTRGSALHATSGSVLHDISPYEYKLIRGIDFYEYCFRLIDTQPNISVEYGIIEKCVSNRDGTYVVLDGERIDAGFIFNSIPADAWRSDNKNIHFLQHFKGWFIKSAVPVFRPDEATLMDFRVSQQQGTTFVYVMPFSDTEALVEYTLFSRDLIRQQDYDDALSNYCRDMLRLGNYTVSEQEFGIIPMTDFQFAKYTGNTVNLGTAGGQTKASSGYTFSFIQKHSRAIVDALISTGKPFLTTPFLHKRFQWFDRTLLQILDGNRIPGAEIFSTLMRTNDMKTVMKFLDNETSVSEEVRIIRQLPWAAFLKAGIKAIP